MLFAPKIAIGILIAAWLAVGVVIGNSMLESAVDVMTKKYAKSVGFRKMKLYSVEILISKVPLQKGGISDANDAIQYQTDFRIAYAYAGLFWISALTYGILCALLGMG